MIISDIDGTITKSDILGHLMPLVGNDWSHPDICEFYTNLRKNNYIIVYLTARNYGQAEKTLNYLKKVKQNKFQLPEGPVILSPDSMYQAFKAEVIVGKKILIFNNNIKGNPEVYKKAVLTEIKNVFMESNFYENPIYSGFGNKSNDALAYMHVGIQKERVYIINPKGDINQSGLKSPLSYGKLNKMINEIFPVVNSSIVKDLKINR